jgi:hypothetical protein
MIKVTGWKLWDDQDEMKHFIDTSQLLQMHEPYTFGISEIEAKTRFGNTLFFGENLSSFDNVWKKKKNLSKTSNQISCI